MHALVVISGGCEANPAVLMLQIIAQVPGVETFGFYFPAQPTGTLWFQAHVGIFYFHIGNPGKAITCLFPFQPWEFVSFQPQVIEPGESAVFAVVGFLLGPKAFSS